MVTHQPHPNDKMFRVLAFAISVILAIGFLIAAIVLHFSGKVS
jgi:hypothetical protein